MQKITHDTNQETETNQQNNNGIFKNHLIAIIC